MRGLLPVYGSRFEVRGSRFEVRGSGFAVRGLRFGVCGFERFNKLNAGLIRGIGFEVRGSRFEVSARPGGEPMMAKKWSGAILFTKGTQRKNPGVGCRFSTANPIKGSGLIRGIGFEVRGLRGLLEVYGSRFEVRGSRFAVRGTSNLEPKPLWAAREEICLN